jgi:hypothetical protein
MKILISEVFIALLAIALLIGGLALVKNSVIRNVTEVSEYLEDRKSVRQVVAEAKRLAPEGLRDLYIEILLWDTQRLMEWLETKSMLADQEKEAQIERCRSMLSEQHAQATDLVRNMRDEGIIELIKTETRKRDLGWRRDLLTRLRG